jgi:hypothetical protein
MHFNAYQQLAYLEQQDLTRYKRCDMMIRQSHTRD